MTLKTSELTITLHRVIDGYSEPSSSSYYSNVSENEFGMTLTTGRAGSLETLLAAAVAYVALEDKTAETVFVLYISKELHDEPSPRRTSYCNLLIPGCDADRIARAVSHLLSTARPD